MIKPENKRIEPLNVLERIKKNNPDAPVYRA